MVKKTTHSTGKQFKYQDHEKLLETLFFMQDMMERSSMPFLLLDTTAKQALADPMGQLYLTKLTLGVRKLEAAHGLRLLKQLIPTITQKGDQLFYLHTNGVPVYIYLLGEDPYYVDPNPVNFAIEVFQTPNPFIEYWHKGRPHHE